MEQDSISIEEFNESLSKWTGKNIKILKQEIEDNDETLMTLEKVSYIEHTETIDDYVAKYALHLNGTGKIENADNKLEQLPLPSYEIPLEDTTTYQFNGSHFTLKNERAAYMIELADK
ncbi:hypothetical protein [Virgibacillus necropolis]|uniref:Uncharacterized protein n=1 Tax=Virgibacillus necropolis TaxID=163877 RepID=A0A221M8C6_9BACI|nr:hypothetical protein [Virgibacillus necropolis]ASN03880.1 hypothetical protein CFK40_02120 [Virgibacillus necropolis]